MKKWMFLFLGFILWSCEDIIDIKVRDSVPQLVVDGWLTDEANTPQSIKLTLSQPYFDDSEPLPALGAQVYVIKHDSTLFAFKDENQTGVYTYTPDSRYLLEENKPIALYINYQGEEFYALSMLKRVPPIDSVRYHTIDFVGGGNKRKENVAVQFFATDFEGQGDTYLVRTIKNDELLWKPRQFTLVYDAGMNPGSGSDGMVFLPPIRMAPNNDGLYAQNDRVTIELFSIPLDAYFFLYQLQLETTKGGVFDTPPSNVPGNIQNLNAESKTKAVGIFFVSKVNRFSSYIN